MRLAVDTGGTFTDLVVEDDSGGVTLHKAPTTPSNPSNGILDAIRIAAAERALDLRTFLGQATTLIHGTTHAINAIITGSTARTAFLTTAGHRDILTLREGGRTEPFNFTVPYPEPYVPRALTFEVRERVLADGRIHLPLDREHLVETLRQLQGKGVEAVAVCLLWSILHPDHEIAVGQIVAEHLPGIPVTLSHRLNPSLREYRRASSAVIDASLKPLMTRYLDQFEQRLADEGFRGRLFIVTSNAGLMPAADVAGAPIHLINSGPSMAPVAGLASCRAADGTSPDAIIVADTGGTTYDVSLVRKGRISRTSDSWVGAPFRGHLTGFPSVDVRSIGAGGGSIATVDPGGMLTVGPRSAGAIPGPAAYGRGGTLPTLTDAALVLGHIDPDYFLGGAIRLDVEAARNALRRHVAVPLGLDLDAAALAVLRVATENMVQAINDITVKQGIDPRQAVLVGGGGAAGFNSVAIARRLGCTRVIIPEFGAALSAAGALMSELSAHFRATRFVTTRDFDQAAVRDVLDGLMAKGAQFVRQTGIAEGEARYEFACDARYPDQVWEIELPLAETDFTRPGAVDRLIEAFHALHRDLFAVHDEGSPVEIVGWTLKASGGIGGRGEVVVTGIGSATPRSATRRIITANGGAADAPVHFFDTMWADTIVTGPALVENSYTTIVIDPDASARREIGRGLVIDITEAQR